MKRDRYRNLRRGGGPGRGRGRLQRQIARAFTAEGPVLSASQIYDWCFTKRRRVTTLKAYMVWRILVKVADRVGRAKTIGTPNLWRWRGNS